MVFSFLCYHHGHCTYSLVPKEERFLEEEEEEAFRNSSSFFVPPIVNLKVASAGEFLLSHSWVANKKKA